MYIKAIFQAISVYAMQCFLLPKILCRYWKPFLINFGGRTISLKKGSMDYMAVVNQSKIERGFRF